MKWLIDEIVLDPMGEERVQWHTIEEAETVEEAFRLAHQRSLRTRTIAGEPMGLYFSADELIIIDEGYRWAAADGSSVCYEVRRLDEDLLRRH
jgi:hypothetical protein